MPSMNISSSQCVMVLFCNLYKIHGIIDHVILVLHDGMHGITFQTSETIMMPPRDKTASEQRTAN